MSHNIPKVPNFFNDFQISFLPLQYCTAEPEIAVGYWPFSNQFSSLDE